MGLPTDAMPSGAISGRPRSRANGQHGERARLRENFRDWILRYVCNAAAAGETFATAICRRSDELASQCRSQRSSVLRLSGDVLRAQCLRRGKAARKHRCEFSANKRPAHEIRDPCPNERVDANVERRSRKEDRPRRTDGVKRVRQIEGVPNGGHADQDGVKTARFAPDRGDGVGRTVETDRLISERRQDFLVAEQTVAVIVNDEHGFALAKSRRRGRLPSRRR